MLLSFVGCRSEKAAFVFPSPTLPTGSKTYAAALSDGASDVPAATLKPNTAQPLTGAATVPSQNRIGRRNPAFKRIAHVARSPVHFQKKPSTALAIQVTQTATSHASLNLVLGGVLVVGGVVAGLVLGGWLGLGVGALIVLLGYYFLMLGVGGPHAWTEIFQEFFNL